MGLRAASARPQRVSGSARIHSRRAESARNPIASHVNFGDDSALSAFTRTQWTAAFSTRTGKGLRITRPGKGGGQILPLPAISASIGARITKLGKRKDTPVNFMVCNFGDLGSIF